MTIVPQYSTRSIIHHSGVLCSIYTGDLAPCEHDCWFEAKVVSDCDLIGINIETEKRFDIPTYSFSGTFGVIYISTFVPKGSKYIIFHNMSNESVYPKLEIQSAKFSEFGKIEKDYKKFKSHSDPDPTRVYIHTIGKTGSITLQRTLQKQPGVFCGRDHWLNLPGLFASENESVEDMVRALTHANTARMHLSLAYIDGMRDLPGPNYLVCGMRSAPAMALAAAFQTFGDAYVTQQKSAADLAQTIRFDDFYSMAEAWWQLEFPRTFGMPINSLEKHLERKNSYWEICPTDQNCRYLFYRIEDGDKALRSICQEITGVKDIELSNENISSEKPYGALYSETKNRIDFESLKSKLSGSLKIVEEIFY